MNDKEMMLELIRRGETFDFRVGPGAPDHEFVESMGYTVKMGGDCSMYSPELKGIGLSSYGSWGTIFSQWLDAESRNVAEMMVQDGVIEFMRTR